MGQQDTPAWDGCPRVWGRAGLGAPTGSQQHLLPLGLVRAAGHWFPVGSLFEPCWDSSPQPLGRAELQDRPNFVLGCQEKAVPSRLWSRGSAGVAGDRGCQAGPSLAPEQPSGHGELTGHHPAPSSWQHSLNYFSHLGQVLGEQISAQLHLSCQSGLAALAEG